MGKRELFVLEGSPSAWLENFRNLGEQMSVAIEAAWPLCIRPLQPKKDSFTHEDHVTEHLVNALRRTKKVPGRIIYQYVLLVEDTEGNVSLTSSIDFVLTVGDDEGVYLAYECKRLNVPYPKGVKNLCVPYVEDGLMRFVTGQYSNGLPMAMMIGYVMNGDNGRARQGLRRVMEKRKATIGLKAEMDHPSPFGAPTRFRSTHTCRPGHSMEVEHLLLPWP